MKISRGGFSCSRRFGDFSSAVSGLVSTAITLSNTAFIAGSISSMTLHSETIFSGTVLITGMPLLEAADMASLVKCSKTKVAVGLPKFSI